MDVRNGAIPEAVVDRAATARVARGVGVWAPSICPAKMSPYSKIGADVIESTPLTGKWR